MKANKSPARKVSGDAFREKDVGKVKNLPFSFDKKKVTLEKAITVNLPNIIFSGGDMLVFRGLTF